MNERPALEHALYGDQDAGGYRFLARSTGFRDEWLREVERICTSFGERPAGVACPRAVFAQPLRRAHVALAIAADQGNDDRGRPGALAFHVVVLPEQLYIDLGGDPFHLAAEIAPAWTERGTLTPLSCPSPAPPRTVADLDPVLTRPDAPNLLGGAQLLIDGGRLVFERSAPDEPLIRGLWQLLPTSARAELWPASFAFGNALRFDVLAVPRVDPALCADYVGEDRAGDHPEGRYELALQIAVESGDQQTLDALLARRSRREVRSIALYLFVAVVVLLATMPFLSKDKPNDRDVDRMETSKEGFTLPPASEFTPLSEEQTREFRSKLVELFGALNAKLSAAEREGSVEELIARIDKRLGTPDPDRDPGNLDDHGPSKRRMRILLWKHGIEQYNDIRLSPPEMVEQLRRKVAPRPEDDDT